MPGKKECLHHAYLVRCWLEGETTGERPRWRFCIEEVLQGEPRQGFEDLDALVAFLRAELVGDQAPDQTLSDGSRGRKGK